MTMTPADYRPGTTFVNPFNKETFIFMQPESTNIAEFEVRLGPGGSGGGNALRHVHPKADEEFTVKTGRLNVSIDGVMHSLEPGEIIMIPRGKAHFFSTHIRVTRRLWSGSSRRRTTFASSSISRWQRKHIRSGSDLAGSQSCSGWPSHCTRSRTTCIWPGRQSGFKNSCSRRSPHWLG